jgi:hypothetical protein
MIKKVIKKTDLQKDNSIKEDLKYWLEKEPNERIFAVDYLRMQAHGNTERLQRIARVIQRP